MRLTARHKKIIGKHVLYLCLLMLSVCITDALHIPCFVRQFTGVPCPTCGATRAMLCLMSLDFAGYFYYNAAAIFIVLAVLVAIHANTALLRKYSKRQRTVFICVASAAVFIYYIYRLFFSNIP